MRAGRVQFGGQVGATALLLGAVLVLHFLHAPGAAGDWYGPFGQDEGDELDLLGWTADGGHVAWVKSWSSADYSVTLGVVFDVRTGERHEYLLKFGGDASDRKRKGFDKLPDEKAFAAWKAKHPTARVTVQP